MKLLSVELGNDDQPGCPSAAVIRTAVPGSAFGAEGYLRLSYATSDAVIAKGLERLGRFCATVKR